MKLSRDDSWALNFWQRLQFQAESLDSSPAQQADAWRRSLFQLQTLKNSGKISSELYLRLCRQVALNYHQVVDNQDSNKGLNNFAEAVLTLANGRRNESQMWKTSLSMDYLQKLPVYKNIMVRADLEGTSSKSAEVSSCSSLSDRPWLTSNNSETLNTLSVLNQDSKESKPSTLVVSKNSSSRVPLNGEKNPWTRIGQSALDTYHKPSNNGTSQDKEQGHISNSYCKQAFNEGSEYKMENLRTMDCPSGVSYNGPGIVTSTTLKRKAPTHYSGSENSTNQLYQSKKSSEDDQMFSLQSSAGPRFFSNYSEDSSRERSGFLFHKPPRQQRVHQSNDVVDDFGSNRMKSKSSDKQICSDDEEQESNPSDFMTARQKLVIDTNKKNHSQRGEASYPRQGVVNNSSYGATRKTLGTRRGPSRQFIPPVLNRNSDDEGVERSTSGYYSNSKRNPGDRKLHSEELEVDERLKNIEPKMVELITSEIMDHGPPLSWDDIAGLEFAKTVIKEIVVWPMLRPDIFKGLRGPPKGILLFGPPGTGKTLIGKCIASQSKATFFSISASSLTSKWVGEGEKMVRALFAVARCHLPAVIFIDEIDSLLSQRTDGEHDASRRIKTEFLVQLDGATTNCDERLLVVGATNRPQEIDEAARRRLVKRLYIPLPEGGARKQIMYNLLSQQKCSLTEQEVLQIVNQTDGYSGSDMANLCREAALGPIRSITDIQCIEADQVRPITSEDFRSALHQVRASVSEKDLDLYIQWNKLYGSGAK